MPSSSIMNLSTRIGFVYILCCISIEVFTSASEVETYSWTGKGLEQVPNLLLNETWNNGSKVDIILSRNNLRTIKDNITCCNDIDVLDLSFNKMISFEISKRDMRIRHLDLSNNALSSTPTIHRETARNISRIDLSFNNIQNLDSAFMETLVGIKNLILSNNQIAVFPGFQKHVPNMKLLDLEHNLIASLEASNLAGLNNTITLELSNNNLKYFPSFDSSIYALEWLYVSQNQITFIPDESLLSLPALVFLDASQNSLYVFPNIGIVGSTLEHLYVWQNEIDQIEESKLRGADKIQTLSVAVNSLKSLPNMEIICPTIKTFQADSNQLGPSIGDRLLCMKSLQLLELGENSLEEIPLLNSSSLLSLKLSRNMIRNNSLANLHETKLEKLDLSYNSLTLMPDLVEGDHGNALYLKDLEIMSNKIDYVSYEAVSNYTSITRLGLSYNPLGIISDLTDIQSLVTIEMEGVELHCNCSNMWLQTWARKRQLIPEAIRCSQNDEHFLNADLRCTVPVTTLEDINAQPFVTMSGVSSEPEMKTTQETITTPEDISRAKVPVTTLEDINVQQFVTMTGVTSEPEMKTTQETITTPEDISRAKGGHSCFPALDNHQAFGAVSWEPKIFQGLTITCRGRLFGVTFYALEPGPFWLDLWESPDFGSFKLAFSIKITALFKGMNTVIIRPTVTVYPELIAGIHGARNSSSVLGSTGEAYHVRTFQFDHGEELVDNKIVHLSGGRESASQTFMTPALRLHIEPKVESSCIPIGKWTGIKANTSDVTVGTTVKYWCEEGYGFKDDAASKSSTCKLSNTWDPPLDVCDENEENLQSHRDSLAETAEAQHAQILGGFSFVFVIMELSLLFMVDFSPCIARGCSKIARRFARVTRRNGAWS